MTSRNAACRWILVANFVIAEAFAIPLLFFAGRGVDWVHWNAVPDPNALKLLGAAMAALGIGSLLASRDPFRHRVVVQMEIVFCFLTVTAMLYRELWGSGDTPDAALAVIGLGVVFFVLFSAFYPRAESAVAAQSSAPAPVQEMAVETSAPTSTQE